MPNLSPNALTDSTADSAPVAVPRLLALLPAGFAFLLYWLTCSPTVNFTDSGELITAAWTGGIAHPPGYPLYTLLGIVFVHLPLGDPAWRMNILSALFAALAVGLFYALVSDTLRGMPAFEQALGAAEAVPRPAARSRPPARPAPAAAARKDGSPAGRKDRRAPAVPLDPVPVPLPAPPDPAQTASAWSAAAGGLAAAGLLACSLTFWNWATQAKFYSLHFAFVAGLLWLALRIHRSLATERARGTPPPRWSPMAWPPSLRLLHLLAFTTGLALTNHFLTFLLLPGLALLVLSPLRHSLAITRRLVRYSPSLLIAGLLPLLLYLYLPIRGNMHPLLAWGLPTTWGDFWRQVTAQSYQGLFGTANLGTHLVDATIYTANQFGLWLGLALVLPVVSGLVYLWHTDRGLLAASALTASIALIVALNYNIREIATYYVPFYMIVLWWAGLGVAHLIRRAPERLPALAAVRHPAASLLASALLPLLALLINWGAAGHGNNYMGERYVRNAFQNFRPNAVVLTNYWDVTSASFYWQHVRGERPDVVVIDKSLLRQPFYLNYLERTYPAVVAKNAAFTEYQTLLRQWIDTGRPPPRLSAAYSAVLNGFIESNLGQRPVYMVFITAQSDPQEQREVNSLLDPRRGQLVPEGFGYRIAAGAEDRATQDPQFDLRGITSDQVPLDEIEASVVALYPSFLQRIAAYLANSANPTEQQASARLLAQAAELQPLTRWQEERPHLR